MDYYGKEYEKAKYFMNITFSSLINVISSPSDEETFCCCLGLHLIVGGFKSGSSSDAKTKYYNIYFMDLKWL